jgi:hypothetical protein
MATLIINTGKKWPKGKETGNDREKIAKKKKDGKLGLTALIIMEAISIYETSKHFYHQGAPRRNIKNTFLFLLVAVRI